MNFRGSGGYGRAFEVAGYERWGTSVQDDILDAIRWAVAQKLADPHRVCTYGKSFGGYAALQLAIRAPELVRCAVGFAGVYDLSSILQESDVSENAWSTKVMEAYLGRDDATLRAESPLHRVDELRAPVLLVHGGEDQRAPIAQAEAMCTALRARDKTCETFFVPTEGHGFSVEAHRFEAMTRIVRFLERHTELPSRRHGARSPKPRVAQKLQ